MNTTILISSDQPCENLSNESLSLLAKASKTINLQSGTIFIFENNKAEFDSIESSVANIEAELDV